MISSTSTIKVSCTAPLHPDTGRCGSALPFLSFVPPKISISVLSQGSAPKTDKRRCEVPANLEKRGGVDFRSPQKNQASGSSGRETHGTQVTTPPYGSTEFQKCISRIIPCLSGPRVANLLRTPSLALYTISRGTVLGPRTALSMLTNSGVYLWTSSMADPSSVHFFLSSFLIIPEESRTLSVHAPTSKSHLTTLNLLASLKG